MGVRMRIGTTGVVKMATNEIGEIQREGDNEESDVNQPQILDDQDQEDAVNKEASEDKPQDLDVPHLEGNVTSPSESIDGVDSVTPRGLFGYTQLHLAASGGHADLVEFLLRDSSNVNVNSKTVDGGYTPLHLAASAGHTSCVKTLLRSHDTSLHITDAFGRTPLQTAEQHNKTDVAKLLRSQGKKYQWFGSSTSLTGQTTFCYMLQ